MRLILLRHGKPASPSPRKINSAEFLGWIEDYDNSGLCPSSPPPARVVARAKACKTIVCSALPRSVESAKALGVGNNYLADPLFNEAGMPASNGRLVTLSPQAWAVIYRALWLLGYSANAESFKAAKSRAVLAVEKLTQIACAHGDVLLVGHGVYNRILANELRRQGWSGPKNPGSGYWSMTVYRRPKTA